MASPPIPELVANGLLKINSLTDSQFQELVTVLESIPLRISQQRVFDDSSINLNTISRDDFNTVRESIFTLYMGSTRVTVPMSTYINDLIEALGKRVGTDWEASEEAVNRFKERLAHLLSIRTLQITVKAFDVLTEHERTFSKARVLTDIRPVFGDSTNSSPEAAIIIHMLSIGFLKNGERGEFVVALDNKDIQRLIEALERAKAKTESLKSTISSTGISYVEVV